MPSSHPLHRLRLLVDLVRAILFFTPKTNQTPYRVPIMSEFFNVPIVLDFDDFIVEIRKHFSAEDIFFNWQRTKFDPLPEFNGETDACYLRSIWSNGHTPSGIRCKRVLFCHDSFTEAFGHGWLGDDSVITSRGLAKHFGYVGYLRDTYLPFVEMDSKGCPLEPTPISLYFAEE